MELYRFSEGVNGLSEDDIRAAVEKSLEGRELGKVLLIPPDYTRFFSNAGLITNIYYHLLTQRGCEAFVLPAVGTHKAVTKAEASSMFGDIPFDRFIAHDWRRDVVKLGEIPADYLAEITDGLWTEPVDAEVNRLVMDESFDLIISIGQVVPHEVVGMANHAKNLFVGVGGSGMINSSHMVGAVYGMERMMGREDTPVRRIFDYGMEHYLSERPVMFVLTVTTAEKSEITTHGLFIGEGRECFSEAVKLSQRKNVNFLPKSIKKCVVFLPEAEFKSTWLGNKAVYRTRMAIADGGELVIIAPGVERFGEDGKIDALIREYGYSGRLEILEQFKKNSDLRENMSAAAHLIHGSGDGRFSISYAAPRMARAEIESVGYGYLDYAETARRYDPEKLQCGFNTMPDGEEIFFIPNPALGLWIDEKRFEKDDRGIL